MGLERREGCQPCWYRVCFGGMGTAVERDRGAACQLPTAEMHPRVVMGVDLKDPLLELLTARG